MTNHKRIKKWRDKAEIKIEIFYLMRRVVRSRNTFAKSIREHIYRSTGENLTLSEILKNIKRNSK